MDEEESLKEFLQDNFGDNFEIASYLLKDYVANIKTSNEDNTNKELRALRLKNLNKLIIAHLNINSLRNKFDLLTFQIKDNVDILMLSETKVDESFPNSQFLINGFSTPYRFDRNARGGGIFLYIREDIHRDYYHLKLVQLKVFS